MNEICPETIYFDTISKHFLTGYAHKNLLNTPNSVTIFGVQYETRSPSFFFCFLFWPNFAAAGDRHKLLLAAGCVKMEGCTLLVGASAKHVCACTVKLCDILKGENALANSARHFTQYLFDYFLSSTEQTGVHHSLQI